MLSFQWWWFGVALVLPFVMFALPENKHHTHSALRLPDLSVLRQAQDATPTFANTQFWRWLLAYLAFACLVLALMRPVWLSDTVTRPLQGRDLMLAIDLSGSMDEQDMRYQNTIVSRLFITKRVASDFVQNRKGDRVGLIVFGAYAYLQTPLTFDRQTIVDNIAKSYSGDADDIQNRYFGTSIGDAIGLAIKRMRANESEQGKNTSHPNRKKIENKTLILLTDGVDRTSTLPPIKAAELAANNGLKIYTIGLGSDGTDNSFFGQLFNRKSDIDEDTLKAIANLTGGKYYRARKADELAKIYAEIDRLEPVESESLSFRPQRALFYYPLALGLFLMGVLGITGQNRFWGVRA